MISFCMSIMTTMTFVFDRGVSFANHCGPFLAQSSQVLLDFAHVHPVSRLAHLKSAGRDRRNLLRIHSPVTGPANLAILDPKKSRVTGVTCFAAGYQS